MDHVRALTDQVSVLTATSVFLTERFDGGTNLSNIFNCQGPQGAFFFIRGINLSDVKFNRDKFGGFCLKNNLQKMDS